jgi:hypothetical protein
MILKLNTTMSRNGWRWDIDFFFLEWGYILMPTNFLRHFLNLHRNWSVVWKGILRRHFHLGLTLLQESTLSRKNGDTGMIQWRNIALEIVVFGPQYVGNLLWIWIAVPKGWKDGRMIPLRPPSQSNEPFRLVRWKKHLVYLVWLEVSWQNRQIIKTIVCPTL